MVLKPGMTADEKELIEFCKERVASFKKPAIIDFFGEIPKSDIRKILRRQVRGPYWKGHERKIHQRHFGHRHDRQNPEKGRTPKKT